MSGAGHGTHVDAHIGAYFQLGLREGEDGQNHGALVGAYNRVL
jgi:hypothetical protein